MGGSGGGAKRGTEVQHWLIGRGAGNARRRAAAVCFSAAISLLFALGCTDPARADGGAGGAGTGGATVNGAAPPKDSALATAAAELHMTANWSLAAKFDGEFARGSQTYAGTGTLRYAW